MSSLPATVALMKELVKRTIKEGASTEGAIKLIEMALLQQIADRLSDVAAAIDEK